MTSRPSIKIFGEKSPATTLVNEAGFEEGARDVQILKVSSDAASLKLAKDGVTVLIPQPSDDPDEPLNWSWTKKLFVLSPLIFASLLTAFGENYGVPLFAPQSKTFNMSVEATSASISGSIFLQGAGSVIAVPVIQRIGRLPVLFWSQLLAALSVMAAALAPNYASFTAFRAIQGFANTAPQVIGLSIVHDMFFFHQRARLVNVWVTCLLGGPYLGPFISSWLLLRLNWRADFGVLSGLYGLSTLMAALLGRETLYDAFQSQQKRSGLIGRVELVLGITGLKATGRPAIWTTCRDIISIQFRPQIFFLTVIYTMVFIAWVIGVNTTVSEIILPPPYSFSTTAEAVSWIAPMIGAVIGQIWGHWFNDWLFRRYINRHGGTYTIENRLWGTYPPTLFCFVGLILYGEAIQHALHWPILLLAWAFIAFSMIATMTSVSAYCLDSFPNHASLVACIISFWRTTGGFCVVYFQIKWISTSGAAVAFGIQAMLLGVAFLSGVVVVQLYGKRWRISHPPPKVENWMATH